MKKQVKQAKQELELSLDKIYSLFENTEFRSIMLFDGDWKESAGVVLDSFKPRIDLFIKKLNKIIEKMPSRRKRKIK